MAYSPNDTERPAFIKACANRKRFVADIIRAVQDDKDYKVLYETIFPSKASPNVKLPSGYKDILEGTLLDGSQITDIQLENVRSNLMEELRKNRSPLSLSLAKPTKQKLQKVVMVTAPKWMASTFQPTAKAVETFDSAANDSKKEPIPTKEVLIARGPLTFMLMFFGVMILALVVRVMLSAAHGTTDAIALSKTSHENAPPVYGSKSQYVAFPPGGDTSSGQMAEGLIRHNINSPQIAFSYGILPGFMFYTIFQIGILFLYIALLPFILMMSNMSKMFGMRSVEFIHTAESVLFAGNKSYTSTPKFTLPDQKLLKEKLQQVQSGDVAFQFGKYYDLSVIMGAIKKMRNDLATQQTKTRISRKLEILLKNNKLDDFVNNNLKRFMETNDNGEYRFSEDALESAMDSYNLQSFDAESLKDFVFTMPDFLDSIRRQSFSYPILVKTGDMQFKIVSRYFWDTSSYRYLKVPPSFSPQKIPQFIFNTTKNSITGAKSVREIDVKFQSGSGLEMVDTIPDISEGAKQNEIPQYLLVQDTGKINKEQATQNTVAAVTRGVGIFSGSIGSMALVLFIIIGVTNALESFGGTYSHYDDSLFQKMVFVTSDAYYGWINRDDVHRSDVAKLNAYISKTNAKIKIIDVSKLNTEKDKINALIDVYNNDVAATSFVRNQLFYRTLYIVMMLTLPFMLTWLVGLGDTRLTFEILGTMGLNNMQDPRAILPGITVVLFLITFIIAITQMSSRWLNTDEKKNPVFWSTVSDLDNSSNGKKAPMKSAGIDSLTNKEYANARKTLRFLTTNGNDTHSSLEEDTQQKRLLHHSTMYNLKAFERSRVLFITDSDNLQGFFMKFVDKKMSNVTGSSESTGHQMKIMNESGSMFGLFTGTMSGIFIVSIVLGMIGLLSTFTGSSSIEKNELNILNNGQAVMNLLFEYLSPMNKPQSYGGDYWMVLGGQIVVLLSAIFTMIYTFAVEDPEIAVGSHAFKHKDTEATELAYGSLAYIDSDARPATKSVKQV